ncbi:MAG: shikimate kinase [Nitrospirota bacterium]
MKNIVLTGFMGTGKTAVGRELSRILNMKLVDVDTEIELSQKMTINDIFKNYGESRFREIETEMIKKIADEQNIIISTGGGAVLKSENIEVLRKNGVIFCLNANPETILERTSLSEERPLLKVDDPMTKIKELLDYRRPFYEKAGITIETDDKTPLEVAEEIIEDFKCRR